MSSDNPLATTSNWYKNTTSASRGSNTGQGMFSGPPQNEHSARIQQDVKQAAMEHFTATQRPATAQQQSTITISGPQAVPKFQSILVERFREKIKARGGRTLFGLARQFKIFDDNNSGNLDLYEFSKAI